jgi:hypothetical protein
MGRKSKGSAVLEAAGVSVNSKEGKEKIMSKEENAATSQETQKVTAETASKKIKFYDLSTFEETEKTVDLSFTPAGSQEEALTRLSAALNSDEEALRDAINSILRDKEFAAQKRTAIGENGAPKKVVLDFIKNWRDVPPYSSLVTTEKGDANWKKEYNAQTSAILKDVKDVPFVVNGIKAKAASFAGSDDDSE